MGKDRAQLQVKGPCPRCARPALEGSSLRGLSVARCAECEGTLAARRDLAGLLEVLARELIAKVDVEQPVAPVPDAGGGLNCPSCSAGMEHFGYMGARQVMIDGCDACGVLWLDADELSSMSLLFARTQLRRDEHEQDVKDRTRTYVDDARAAFREASNVVRQHFIRYR